MGHPPQQVATCVDLKSAVTRQSAYALGLAGLLAEALGRRRVIRAEKGSNCVDAERA